MLLKEQRNMPASPLPANAKTAPRTSLGAADLAGQVRQGLSVRGNGQYLTRACTPFMGLLGFSVLKADVLDRYAGDIEDGLVHFVGTRLDGAEARFEG